MRHGIIVPAYNERDQIGALLSKITPYYQVLAVIDGDDGTDEVARSYNAEVCASTQKRGYGKAVIDGLECMFEAGFDYVTVMDVGTCDPNYLSVDPYADILVRYRTHAFRNATLKRAALSRSAAIAMSLATAHFIPDPTYGYRTYNMWSTYPILEYVRANGHATNMEILGLAINHGLTIHYKPVPYQLDENSQLKANDLKEALRCIWRVSFIHQLLT